jgi:serine/threonine protein kinase
MEVLLEPVARKRPDAEGPPAGDFGRMYLDDGQQAWGYEDSPSQTTPVAEPFRAGRYVILQHVGHGAMGNVYAAYDPDLDRKVAVKVLRDSTRGRPLPASLAREAKAMAKLVHPHVVTVFDVGHCERGVFVAMEFVEGLTLRTWLKQQERSWREVLAAFVQAGQGLAAAHAAGVIHHDFKPDNVLVSAGGGVKVADFGLARVARAPRRRSRASSATPPGTRSTVGVGGPASGSATPTQATERGPVGTLAYMAPERHLLRPADARSDQFSFCVALHEALYRERPFAGTDLASAARGGAVRRAGRAAAREPGAGAGGRGAAAGPGARAGGPVPGDGRAGGGAGRAGAAPSALDLVGGPAARRRRRR